MLSISYNMPCSQNLERFVNILNIIKTNKQTNSGAFVRQQTIPTERPPLVGEVSANFSG
jgi:hypothetical protein